MFEICPKCGKYSENKEIAPDGPFIICPFCNHRQRFLRMPLLVVTGASGTGKTTAYRELLYRDKKLNAIILEGDLLWRKGFADAEGGIPEYRNIWLSVCAHISQNKLPVALFLSISPGEFEECCNRKYFSEIHYLVLVCKNEVLKDRLYKRELWRFPVERDKQIQVHLDWNQMFLKHHYKMKPPVTNLDTSDISVKEVATKIAEWIESKIKNYNIEKSNMRHPHRAPMPELSQIFKEANELLIQHNLPPCDKIEPVSDQDTANPVVIGYADTRKYVIKCNVRFPMTLEKQLFIANLIAERSGLPIPIHLCCSPKGKGLALMIMEWMPGEQIRLLLPQISNNEAKILTQDWGHCIAKFHSTKIAPEEIPDWQILEDSYKSFINYLNNTTSEIFEELQDTQKWLAVKLKSITLKQLENTQSWVLAKLDSIRNYISCRQQTSLGKPVSPGLIKADQDVREVLGLLKPHPHISAILDWERVEYGDQIWELVSLFVRLHLMKLGHLWSDFKEGYEKEFGKKLTTSPTSELYTMVRALISVTRGASPDISINIIKGLLEGTEKPFTS